jgi:hypothetical protein
VELVAPATEHLHSDLPIIVPRVRDLLRRRDRKVIMDVGGDDSGARVVGSLTDAVRRDETDCLLVLNFRRPFTPDPEQAVAMAREIEAATRVTLTGWSQHPSDGRDHPVVREGWQSKTGRSVAGRGVTW